MSTPIPEGNSAPPSNEVMAEAAGAISRRKLMLGTGLGALAGVAAGAFGTAQILNQQTHVSTPEIDPPSALDESIASGKTQAGVARPATPQRHAQFFVADFDLTEIKGTLRELGDCILNLTSGAPSALFPDGPGDLTVLVGLGTRAIAALPAGSEIAESLVLPTFTGDAALEPRFIGGDLLLCVAANDPGVIDPTFSALKATVPGLSLRWSDSGFRGPGSDGIARNPFGFHDGIIVPRGEEQLHKNVWVRNGPLSDGTYCVLRRFVLQTDAFQALSETQQNEVFGRDKLTGVPLSGGTLRSEGNLVSKTEAGDFIVPSRSHLRAAHPSFTGSSLMLRRSYNFASAPIDGSQPGTLEQGLLFMSFQNDIRSFVRTQQRMDETDDLMKFARATATAAFAILPGFDARRPLGSALSDS